MIGPRFRGDDGGVGERGRQSGGKLDDVQPHIAAALLRAGRAKALAARRIRHPDRCLDRPRAQSAPAHAVLVLVDLEPQGSIHG
jgi:hypothetical protein